MGRARKERSDRSLALLAVKNRGDTRKVASLAGTGDNLFRAGDGKTRGGGEHRQPDRRKRGQKRFERIVVWGKAGENWGHWMIISNPTPIMVTSSSKRGMW